MKITAISLYQADLPLKEGSYAWASQSFAAFDTTVVAVETDNGLIGYGETCPLGPAYLAAFAEGARAAIAMIAPNIIGMDPRDTEAINDRMDAALKGHPYAKSALDMACWDLFGKATGLPVYRLLGGMRQERVRLFKVISRAEPELMAERCIAYQGMGFRNYQMKVGENPDTDVVRFQRVAEVMQPGEVMDADANTGWRQHDAMRVVDAVHHLPAEHGIRVYIEQPCLTYEECLAIRQHTNLPMILDECMDSLPTLLRGYNDRAMDLINLKINRMGGLTRSRQVRDLCISLGIAMTIEDSWGGEIATSAIAHLAQSTPESFHFQSSAFHEYHTVAIGQTSLEIADGFMSAGEQPGLGVIPDFDALGAAVHRVSA